MEDDMDQLLDLFDECQMHNSEDCLLFCSDLGLDTCIACGKRSCSQCCCPCGMPDGWSGGELTDEEIDAAQQQSER